MNRVVIPGFGTGPELFSGWPETTGCVVAANKAHSYTETADELNRLSQKGPLDIFAWSMGTLFALRWTAERPESVKSLFLTGATARFCAAEGYENGIESAKLREMARLLVKNKDGVMRAFFSSFLEESSAKPAILARLMRNVPGPEILLSGLAELDGMDLLEEIPSIKARVRIVQGSRDRITPVFGAEEIAARLPGAELSVVDGNHAVFLEQPGVLEQEWVKWTS